MSFKEQYSILTEVSSFKEEVQENKLEGTDVDSCFCRKKNYFSQSHHQIAQIIKGSIKKKSATKLFHFWNLKTGQRYILIVEIPSIEKEVNFSLDKLHVILKAYGKASNSPITHVPKPKVEVGPMTAKKVSLLIVVKPSENIPTEKFVRSVFLNSERIASFSWIKMINGVNNSFLKKLLLLLIAWETLFNNSQQSFHKKEYFEGNAGVQNSNSKGKFVWKQVGQWNSRRVFPGMMKRELWAKP